MKRNNEIKIMLGLVFYFSVVPREVQLDLVVSHPHF